MQFEANFRLEVPNQEYTFVLLNDTLETTYYLDIPTGEATFVLSN